MNQIEKIGMAFKEHLKFMKVRTVQDVHYDRSAQKLPKEKTENYILMKNGNHKKNILERSFRMKKQVKSMENEK